MNVYFDNSATTKPFPEVIHSMSEVLERYYANPSSLHPLGGEVNHLLTRSKEWAAQLLGIEENEVFFTSGGTESNNLALKGVAFAYQQRGKHIITTQVEHASVYEACQALEKDYGFEVTYLPLDQHGLISVEDVKKSLKEDTILVSIMHVNNELGSIQPIAEIGKLLQAYPKILFHVDDVQGLGKVPLPIKNCYIDLLSISGHKLHAPKGTGLLYVRKGIHLYPLLHGGEQQHGLRPGTENMAGIVAFVKALRIMKNKEDEHINHLVDLRNKAIQAVQQFQYIHINSAQDPQIAAPHILNVSFIGCKPEVLVHALAEKGVYVSTKSACSSKIDKPSRILTAVGSSAEIAKSAIRISFSIDNTLEEVGYFAKVLQAVIPHYQTIFANR